VIFLRNLAADDVVFETQLSSDLENWSPLGTTFVSAANNGDGTETVSYRSTTPLASIPREFIRLQVRQR
jgi:hypothetical protein